MDSSLFFSISSHTHTVLPYFFATKSDPEAWKMQYAISLDCNSDGNAIYLFLAFFLLEKNTILKLFFCIFYTSMLVNNHIANLILRRIEMCIEEIVNQRAEMKKKWKNPNRLSKFFFFVARSVCKVLTFVWSFLMKAVWCHT